MSKLLSAGDPTRRALLAGGAAALVVAALVPAGSRMVLRRPQPAVRMVFEITDLAHLFVIED